MRYLILAVIVVAGVSCSNPSSPTPAAPRGEVSDPSGDATSSPLIAVSPDMTSATLEVVGDTLTVTVRFAAGTFDPGTWVSLYLDTDQNTATGEGASGPGADYLVSTFSAGFATVSHFQGSGFSSASDRAPLTVIPNGMEIRVPLSMLANDDGRMNFRLAAQASLPAFGPGVSTPVVDWLPDIGKPPGTVR